MVPAKICSISRDQRGLQAGPNALSPAQPDAPARCALAAQVCCVERSSVAAHAQYPSAGGCPDDLQKRCAQDNTSSQSIRSPIVIADKRPHKNLCVASP